MRSKQIFFWWTIHLTQIHSPNVTSYYVDNQLMNNYWNWTLPLAGQNQYFRRCFAFLNPFPMICSFVITWIQLSYSSTDSFLDLKLVRIRVCSTASSPFSDNQPLLSFPESRWNVSLLACWSSLKKEPLDHLPEAVRWRRAFLRPEPRQSITVHQRDFTARKLVKDTDRSAWKNPGVPQKDWRESRGRKWSSASCRWRMDKNIHCIATSSLIPSHAHL